MQLDFDKIVEACDKMIGWGYTEWPWVGRSFYLVVTVNRVQVCFLSGPSSDLFTFKFNSEVFFETSEVKGIYRHLHGDLK